MLSFTEYIYTLFLIFFFRKISSFSYIELIHKMLSFFTKFAWPQGRIALRGWFLDQTAEDWEGMLWNLWIRLPDSDVARGTAALVFRRGKRREIFPRLCETPLIKVLLVFPSCVERL